MTEEQIKIFKEKVSEEIKTIKEIAEISKELQNSKSEKDKKMIVSHIASVKTRLESQQKEIDESLNQLSLVKSLDFNNSDLQIPKEFQSGKKPLGEIEIDYNLLASQNAPSPPLTKRDLSSLEKISLKRLGRKKSKISIQKEEKPSKYVNISVRTFYNLSRNLIYSGTFSSLKGALVKANMQFIPENYVSVIFFTTLLSIFASIFLFVFFLFFNVSSTMPMISLAGEAFGRRILKTFWILFVIPLGTFFALYIYPSLEKKSIEGKINQELPFVTIHMSSIAGAMKDPSKMFGIIIATGEYPNIQKEFLKVINEIHIYGYDLVSALRNNSFNCPSRKLAELYNGISTTISSGGNLEQFFEKRAETLLFDYKIEREKYNKSTETFMDIYLSVVIAAPMILMLLLIIMRVSGLGISLSTSMISLVTILGVTVANIFFLIFLYIKQPSQ
jgi:flagellar protein FlaJ